MTADAMLVLLCITNVEGQQREPATGDARNATRRARWCPFDAPTGSTLLISARRSTRCSRLPMRHVIRLLSTGWQDGQDGSGPRRRTCSSCHPVILSDLSRDVPVLVSGYSERLRERREAAGNGLYNQAERGGCLLFARRYVWAMDSLRWRELVNSCLWKTR
jgi:hypothetical protein